jgi:hypothetical protein
MPNEAGSRQTCTLQVSQNILMSLLVDLKLLSLCTYSTDNFENVSAISNKF